MQGTYIINIILLGFFLFPCKVCGQGKWPHASDYIDQIRYVSLENDNSVKLYIVDFETLEKLRDTSSSKYKIFMWFCDFCKPCFSYHPKIIQLVNDSPDKYELFFIGGQGYGDFKSINKYLSKLNYTQPVYMIDPKKYKKRSVFSTYLRLEDMTEHFCKECNVENMGMSSCFIFDEENKIIAIFEDENHDVVLEKISQLP